MTAVSGARLFLLAVVIHPKRDCEHIAEVGQLYGLTHGVEAIGLILQVLGLTGIFWPRITGFRPRDLTALYAALLGTIWYFVAVSHQPNGVDLIGTMKSGSRTRVDGSEGARSIS